MHTSSYWIVYFWFPSECSEGTGNIYWVFHKPDLFVYIKIQFHRPVWSMVAPSSVSSFSLLCYSVFKRSHYIVFPLCFTVFCLVTDCLMQLRSLWLHNWTLLFVSSKSRWGTSQSGVIKCKECLAATNFMTPSKDLIQNSSWCKNLDFPYFFTTSSTILETNS